MKRLLCFFLVLCLSGCSASLMTESAVEESRFLMDTVCTIKTDGAAKEAVEQVFSALLEMEQRVNLYDQNSTVAAFNRAAAGEPIALDEHTFAIVSMALAVAEASGGAFDITIAPLSTLWPFHGEENPTPPDETALQEALSYVDYTQLVLDKENRTLTKTKDGVCIDLGGAAKGYGADLAVTLMKEKGVPWGIVNLGGNVAVFGENPKKQDGHFSVGIQKPFAKNGQYSQLIDLSEESLVTCGVYQRNFIHENVLYHHILDPKTGYPVSNGLASVSIKSTSSLLADCLSTACMVLGKEEGQRLADAFLAILYTEPMPDKLPQ